MNKTLRSILKITTSLLTVCMVILATCAAPALAASDGIYNPADYIYRVVPGGDTETVYFVFDVEKLYHYSSSYTGNVETFFGSHSYQVSPYETYVSINVYPLGVRRINGQNMTSGVVDIRDFKKRSVLNISMGADLTVAYRWMTTATETDETPLTVNSYYSIYYYDANGNYLTTVSSSTVRDVVNIPGASAGSQGVYEHMPIDYTVSVTVPDDAVYMLPRFCAAVYMNNAIGTLVIDSIQAATQDFGLSISRSLVLEQTETLQAIEDGIDDLNDKADTLIDGSEEMQDKADEITNQGQDLEEQLDSALKDLEELEENSGQDLSAPIQSISDFLRDGSWFSIIDLIKPIMDFPPLATILTILVAFINISILFFGR